MLYKEYGNMNILDEIELYEVVEYLKLFYESITDKKLWDLYLVNYANMTKDTFKSFENWKGKSAITSKPKTKEDKEKIKRDIEVDTELMLMGFRGQKPPKREVK